jgi:ABC-2 type transport system permease protein
MRRALEAEPTPHVQVRVARSPGTVVVELTARKAVRSGVLWGYIFGATVASSALSYSSFYKTQSARDRLAAAFGSNEASAALFGPARELQTVAGFTVFKTFLALTIIGAVWGLLTSTRLLRGEEDSGRWELLLAGQTTRRGATFQALVGTGGGVFALLAITAVFTSVVGLSSKVNFAVGPALYFALSLASGAIMFVALGTLSSQLAATRRQAASYAAIFLGVSYAIRMVADSGIGLHGLVWASPLGWTEQLQPLTSPHPFALLPIFAFTVAMAGVSLYIADRRDIGASAIPDESSAKPRLRLLFGPIGLAVRTLEPVVVGWLCAIAATALITGLIAKAAGGTISGSSVQRVFSKLGAPGTGTQTFLGISLLILAILVAFVAAGQIAVARSEESSGRLDNILVRPVSRLRWLYGRLSIATSVLIVSGLVAGIFTWLAAASQHSGENIATLLGAGLNVVPPAICILGIGALTMGISPRAVSVVTYSLLGWSLLIELVGGIGTLSHWILDTSLFHQMASAPATPSNWGANGGMLGIGIVGCLLGGVAFKLRDLQGE